MLCHVSDRYCKISGVIDATAACDCDFDDNPDDELLLLPPLIADQLKKLNFTLLSHRLIHLICLLTSVREDDNTTDILLSEKRPCPGNIIADSASAEYCSTFQCPSSVVCVSSQA